MTIEPTPTQLLDQGDALWDRLWPAISEGDGTALLAPGVAGDWSARDVLMHLARWHEHGVERLEAHLADLDAISRDGYEAWNIRWHAEDQDIPPSDARQRCEQSRTAIRSLLASLEDSQWDEVVRGVVAGVVNEHYQEHLDYLAEA
jgi:mycothiol maleylpyruvate isomerase-like protein